MNEFDWYNNIHNFIYREEIIDSEPEINSSEDINKYINLEEKLRENSIDNEDIKDITLKKINFKSIKKIEHYLNKLFYIQYNFSANIFLKAPLKHLIHCRMGDYDDLYGSSSYMIIFPNDGVRISCTLNFIKTIPFQSERFSNNWKEKTIKLSYDFEGNILPGPELYICYLPLESLVYRKMTEEEKRSINYSENNDYYFEDETLLNSIMSVLGK